MKKHIFFLSVLTVFSLYSQKPWTQSYSKKYSGGPCSLSFVFLEKNIRPFSQIIVSWNTQRPEQGHYQFSVRVHDKKTQTWRAWHTYAQWGAHEQKSFYSRPVGSGDRSENCFVRFEARDLADGFEICVKKVGDHVDCTVFEKEDFYLHVCCSDLKKREPECADDIVVPKSVQLPGIPRYSQMALGHQDFSVLCMPTALSMAAQYISGVPVDPVDCARLCYDHGLKEYGSWPFCAATVYEKTKGRVACRAQRLHDFKSLYNFLERGFPVVVSVRGPYKIPGAFKVYRNGHAIVVTGFDVVNKRVLCHDPAFLSSKDVVRSYTLADFLAAWEASDRLAFVFNQV